MLRFSGLSKKIPGVVFSCLLILCLMAGGCATISSNDSIGSKSVAKSTFVGKKMAVLPVQSARQTLSTDSIQSLKIAINRILPDRLKEKFPGVIIVDPGASMEIISAKGHNKLLEEIYSAYETTGFTPKQAVALLGRDLHSDYLVFSKLRAEKMDLSWLSKGFGGSLEVLILDAKSNKIVDGGVAQFKRGGIFGTGGTSNSEAAQELVRLVMEKL